MTIHIYGISSNILQSKKMQSNDFENEVRKFGVIAFSISYRFEKLGAGDLIVVVTLRGHLITYFREMSRVSCPGN